MQSYLCFIKGNIVRESWERVVYRPELGKCPVPVGLRSVGHAVFVPGKITAARRINFIQVLWTVRGEGYVRIGAHDYALGEGWAAFCFPDSPHSLCAGKSDWEYRWCTVDGTHALSLTESFGIGRVPFHAGSCKIGLFSEMARSLEEASFESGLRGGSLAYGLLSLLAGISRATGGRYADAYWIKILDGISASVCDPDLCMKRLTRDTGLSRFAIHRMFLQRLNTSPKRYIDALRLRKALSLLRETGLAIEDVATETGFANANYFAKFIRRKTSFSPSQFRQAGTVP